MRLGYIPNQEVTFQGETHTHTLVGPVEDDSEAPWPGYRSRPLTCGQCIDSLAVKRLEWQAQMRAKRGLPDDFYFGE